MACGSNGSRAERPLRILLAEDNPINQKVTVLLLQKAGHSVVAVSNGAEALEAFARETETFDLILMDIQMPVINGYEARSPSASRIGNPPAHPHRGANRACHEGRPRNLPGSWNG